MNDNVNPIGIDLGTTNSVIGTSIHRDFEIIPSGNGERTTPSVVSYDTDAEQVFVGKQAANRAITYPEQTVESVKRHMGSKTEFELGPDVYQPEEVSALIIKQLVENAESHLSTSVDNAVITVPAYFDESQRKATKVAGEIAGLTVDRIIPEPTAACFAYGLQQATEKTVFVYDLGGGTFDCAIVDISNGMIEVRSVDGDDGIGGDDYDGLVVSWIIDQIVEEYGSKPAIDNPKVEALLFKHAADAKHELTSRQSTRLNLPYITLENGDTVNVELPLSRDTFNEIIRGPTEETVSIAKEFLAKWDLEPQDIDDVLLVGGATRTPLIQSSVRELFGQKPQTGINPDEVVAFGATAQACIIHDEPTPDISSTNIVPNQDRGTSSVLSDQSENGNASPVLIDSLPQTVGMKLIRENSDEAYFQPLIAEGETLPAKTTISTSPAYDQQTHTTIEVFQGTGNSLKANTKLDEFTLGPYPPTDKGERDHMVTINIDQDGLIYLEAVDEDYNIRADIEIETEFGRTESEIEDMKQSLPSLRE